MSWVILSLDGRIVRKYNGVWEYPTQQDAEVAATAWTWPGQVLVAELEDEDAATRAADNSGERQ